MDDVGIEYQTVLGYPPVEFVHLAADLGCHAISMKASTGPYNAANPYGYGDFSFLEDVGGRRQMAAALRERATRANVVTMDADLGRSFDQFAAFAEAAADRGLQTTLEFANSLPLVDIMLALPAGAAGRRRGSHAVPRRRGHARADLRPAGGRGRPRRPRPGQG